MPQRSSSHPAWHNARRRCSGDTQAGQPTQPEYIRAQLSRLIDEASTTHERFEITRSGRRAAVLLSADDDDTLQDTIAVLSDAALLAAHHEGRAAIEADDYLDADQLRHAMRAAGRLRG